MIIPSLIMMQEVSNVQRWMLEPVGDRWNKLKRPCSSQLLLCIELVELGHLDGEIQAADILYRVSRIRTPGFSNLVRTQLCRGCVIQGLQGAVIDSAPSFVYSYSNRSLGCYYSVDMQLCIEWGNLEFPSALTQSAAT